MKTEQTGQPWSSESRRALAAFVREFAGTSRGREDDDHPLPPGPWDPVVRVAMKWVAVMGFPVPWRFADSVSGPQPEPWSVLLAGILPEIIAATGRLRPGEKVALNPQPLPPRYALLAEVVDAVRSRAEVLQELADATTREDEQRGIIIVGGYTSRFCDDWCGNGFRLKWPFPGPRPSWFADELNGTDLIFIGALLDQASEETFSGDLRRHLADASTKFLEAGLSRTVPHTLDGQPEALATGA
jgi:hypothetical protein